MKGHHTKATHQGYYIVYLHPKSIKKSIEKQCKYCFFWNIKSNLIGRWSVNGRKRAPDP